MRVDGAGVVDAGAVVDVYHQCGDPYLGGSEEEHVDRVELVASDDFDVGGEENEIVLQP